MTTVQIPDDMAKELMAFTRQQTPEAAVLKLASDFLAEQYRKQRQVLDFEGQFDADPTYDYKEQRRVPRVSSCRSSSTPPPKTAPPN
ncbi:hypothetical protein, partial [Deinococcus saxicola]